MIISSLINKKTHPLNKLGETSPNHNSILKSYIYHSKKILFRFSICNSHYPIIKKLTIKMVKVKISKKYMFIFFTEQITLLRSNGKLGTARNYKRTLNSFSSFLKGKDIPLSACSEELVCNYDIYLQSRRMSRNTRSFYGSVDNHWG